MEFRHYSVLLGETIECLDIKPSGIYVDGTLGGGGHSLEIAKRLEPGGRLIGIDQDDDAIKAAGERLKDYKDHVTLVRDNYENMVSILKNLGISSVDGIVLDLGVSSYQIDTPERGFSYQNPDEPLDMRMDRRNPSTAAIVLNTYPEDRLFEVIRDYGEERYAREIARGIVRERNIKPLNTTGDLIRVIEKNIPAKGRRTGGNPAKRTFQAIRIEVNRELTVLKDSLDGMIDILNPGGRLCVITFHSLEDHIVKADFRKNENPCICPPEFPVCVCGRVSKGHVLKRKPILPGERELSENKRSRSAHLRVFVKK